MALAGARVLPVCALHSSWSDAVSEPDSGLHCAAVCLQPDPRLLTFCPLRRTRTFIWSRGQAGIMATGLNRVAPDRSALTRMRAATVHGLAARLRPAPQLNIGAALL